MDNVDSNRARRNLPGNPGDEEVRMDIALSPEMEQLVQEKVKSGGYRSAADLVEDALLLLLGEEEVYPAKLAALRREIQKGIDDLDQGRRSPGDEVFARLRARRGRPPKDQEDDAKLDALRSAVDVGLAEIERGEAIPGPLAVDRIRAEMRRRREGIG
jgi:antitoxin ParD1/3/4